MVFAYEDAQSVKKLFAGREFFSTCEYDTDRKKACRIDAIDMFMPFYPLKAEKLVWSLFDIHDLVLPSESVLEEKIQRLRIMLQSEPDKYQRFHSMLTVTRYYYAYVYFLEKYYTQNITVVASLVEQYADPAQWEKVSDERKQQYSKSVDILVQIATALAQEDRISALINLQRSLQGKPCIQQKKDEESIVQKDVFPEQKKGVMLPAHYTLPRGRKRSVTVGEGGRPDVSALLSEEAEGKAKREEQSLVQHTESSGGKQGDRNDTKLVF